MNSKLWQLIILLVSNPALTFRLSNYKRVKNGLRAIFLRQGNWDLLFKRYQDIYQPSANSLVIQDIKSLHKTIGDVVFFPAIDWNFRFQRPQHLAREFAKRGYRVFYISTTPTLTDTKAEYLVKQMPHPGVILVELSTGSSQILDFYEDYLSDIQLFNLKNAVDLLQLEFKIHAPTVLVQHPFWWPLIKHIQSDNLLYDCIDYHNGFEKRHHKNLSKNEAELIISAKHAIATSTKLHELLTALRKSNLISNGCEYDRFNKQTNNNKLNVKTVIGYVGVIGEWFDSQLISDLANSRPNFQFHFYGAIHGANINRLRRLPNVRFFGEINYTKVPEVIIEFDVCIIPFKVTPLTIATNPVKLYEYLAAGKPVVATNLPELRGLESLDVFCATTSNDTFLKLLEHALTIKDDQQRILIRKNYAKENDWANKADEFIRLFKNQ